MLKEDCWKGYRQYGYKEKDGRTVPNCVKENIDLVVEELFKEYCNENSILYRTFSNIEHPKCLQTYSNPVLSESEDNEIDEISLEEGYFPSEIKKHLMKESLLGEKVIIEAVYKGKKVKLNKPSRGTSKKYKVYVNSGKKNKDGEIVAKLVHFGSKGMEIKRDNAKNRKSFRARHKCNTAKDRKTPRYWSCKFWQKNKSVSDLLKGK